LQRQDVLVGYGGLLVGAEGEEGDDEIDAACDSGLFGVVVR
jgi:hypothetical protein